MRCPFCSRDDTQVLESRAVNEGHAVRRRRECTKCEKRFTTYETIKGSVLWVVKKDGRREAFDPEKMRRGILRAIEKRPVALSVVDRLLDQVEREMLRKEKQEVTSGMIGKALMRRLKKVDQVAWLRFASVYLEFENLKDFTKAAKS